MPDAPCLRSLPLIGVLSNAAPETIASRRKGLSKAGYIDGPNVAVEFLPQGSLSEQCINLVARHAAVIVADGNVAAQTAKSPRATVPCIE